MTLPKGLSRLVKAFGFAFFYLREVIACNLRVAFDVVTPTHYMRPAFLVIPIEYDLSDLQLMLLANLITMAPGTLSLDVTDDRKKLLLHAMYVEDEEAVRAEIVENYQKRIKEVFE